MKVFVVVEAIVAVSFSLWCINSGIANRPVRDDGFEANHRLHAPEYSHQPGSP